MSTQQQASQSREVSFVTYLYQRCQQDKGFAARLRRADNPSTEYQSWDTLATFGVNLEWADERLPFALIAAAVARSDQMANGSVPLGQAIALAFSDGRESDQAKTRLRRLLACDDTEEVCRILRPLLTLIRSRVRQPMDYAALLVDLRWFHHSSDRAKARWAQQFYGKQGKEITA
ncbi:MAG: type I-E CRISPR-associated protein Cse2/CasB [Aeromonas sp.]